nr:histidine phosphatase family protein [Mangrovicella endophytica]
MVRLIRHAAHGQLGHILTGRMPGIGLSKEGEAQARALGRRMARLPITAVRVSPQQRTRETAAIAFPQLADRLAEDSDLAEIDFGAWSGQSFAELEDDPAWRHWNEARGEASTPAGETMSGVAARMQGAIARLRDGRERQVALVSHCDTIKAVVCRTLGLPFSQLHRFDIAPASVTTLVVGDWGAKLLALNEVSEAQDHEHPRMGDDGDMA